MSRLARRIKDKRVLRLIRRAAFPKTYFDRCGLLSLLEQRLRFQLAS